MLFCVAIFVMGLPVMPWIQAPPCIMPTITGSTWCCRHHAWSTLDWGHGILNGNDCWRPWEDAPCQFCHQLSAQSTNVRPSVPSLLAHAQSSPKQGGSWPPTTLRFTSTGMSIPVTWRCIRRHIHCRLASPGDTSTRTTDATSNHQNVRLRFSRGRKNGDCGHQTQQRCSAG